MDKVTAEALIDGLRPLATLSQEELKRLADGLLALGAADFESGQKLRELAKQVAFDEATVVNGVPALLTIFIGTVRFDRTFEDVLRTLLKAKLEDEEISALSWLASRAEPALKAAWDYFDARTAPDIPISGYAGMRTRVIRIAEYDKEFSVEDGLEEYQPRIKHFHTRALITIRTAEDKTPFSFVADNEDLERIIKFLQFARKQLDVVLSAKSK